MDFDLFVIGGGSAGVRCARIAAGHGARVGVAEERFWGGTCVNVGCVPKKLLVQAGEYGAWAEDAAGFGWTIKKGPHDWAKLIAAKDREIGRLNGIYKRLLDNAGATSLRGARHLHRSAHARCRRQARHRRAHRHRHRRPSGAPADPRRGARHHLGRRVLSAAHAEARRDHRLAATSRWNSPASSPLSARRWIWCTASRCRCAASTWTCANRWSRHSARRASRCIPASLPTQLDADGDERVLTLDERHARCAPTWSSSPPAARRPRRGSASTRSASTLNDAGAVVVDQNLRTSQPHIYAMGDVTDRLNLTPVAIAEGHALADTLFGKQPARHLAAQRADRGVLHAADRDRAG